MAAVRETFEETGLSGALGDVGETHNESWNQVRTLGLAPDLAKLSIGHAITPASKAFRFNARFLSWESDMSGELEAAVNLQIWRS